MLKICIWLITVTLVVYVASYVLIAIRTDDTDKSFFKRSGLTVYIDYKTGVEYLGTVNGGLIKREK